ncbi:MAG: hypothetical protein EOM21_20600, partial [Gammaproteobacteria bacterium]|nr:hypothetical protein [Gammaproteobacteria bacterium]
MEVIPPYPTSLHGTPSTPVYTYPAWATSTSYANGDIVRWEGSGTWRDYRSRRAHLSSATRTPVSTVYWTDLGPSSTTTGMTYTTNVAISLSDAWTSGAAVAARQQVYDLGDHHDYVATAALTSAQNTLRPSQAIRSSDPAVAARWVDLGAANAWAVLDGLANSYLIGLNASGNSVNPTFTVNVTNAWYGIDRICVTGMAGVSKIEAKVYVADALVETVTQATAGVAPFWRRPRTAILPVTQAGSATAAKIELTFTRAGGSRVNIGLIVVGKSYAIANTHWG